jgi:hypothetical protein
MLRAKLYHAASGHSAYYAFQAQRNPEFTFSATVGEETKVAYEGTGMIEASGRRNLREGGLAEAHATPRFASSPSPPGSGAGVLMDRLQQEDEQEL